MTNEVFEAGKAFAEALRQAGAHVIATEGSTNRYGQHSFYIQLPSHRIRVSDHDCNDAFRVNEASLPFNALPEATDYMARVAGAAAAQRARRDAENAAAAEIDELRRHIIAHFQTAKGGRYTREKLDIMPADHREKLFDRARAERAHIGG